jgi:hypothetical protein
MSNSTLDRIRDANPYPVDLSPLPIETVQRRIAETGASPPVLKRRISLPGFSAVIAGLGAAVAVAIAVLAIVTLGHRAPRVSPAGTGRPRNPGARVTGIRAERQELITSLGVLRRAQSTADREATLPSPFRPLGLGLAATAALQARERKQGGDPSIDRPLVRMIRTSAGDEISIVPETFQPSTKSPTRAEGIAIAIQTRGNPQAVDTGPRPVSVSYFTTHGLAIFNDTRRGAVLVPDGVARVTLVGFGATQLGARATVDSAKIAGKTAAVHDNLASFTLSDLSATSRSGSGSFGGSGEVRMIWFNASGQVIAHTATDFSTLYITIHGPAPSPATVGIQPLSSADLGSEIHTPAFANAAGEATLVRANGQIGLRISASGLPFTPTGATGAAYGVWLLGPSNDPRFLGYIASQPRNGHISVEVPLSAAMMGTESSIELTLEHGTKVGSVPGEVVLRGKLP